MIKIIRSTLFLAFLTITAVFSACKDTNSRQTEGTTSIDTIKKEQPVLPTSSNKVKLYAWVDQLRVRATADKKSEIVEEIAEGGALTFLEEKSDFTEKINLRGTLFNEPWLKVKTASGKTGWVYGGGVKFYAPIVDQSSSPYDDCMELQRDGKNLQAHDCEEKVRQWQLKANQRWVQETKENIILTLLDGSKSTFKNQELTMDTENYTYRYSYYIPQMGYHVLRAFSHEWSGYVLVNDKSGKKIDIFGYPKASPDFKHLVVTNLDLMAGFEYNGVGLWGFTENGLEKIFDQELLDYGPVTPIWLDNKTVEITFLPGEEQQKKKKVKLLQGADGEWTLLD